ncbi:MAG: UpxY family transcription antiterminator [Bacteroidetes bacterium]|nr:UpxY family transcription antiterminator [Bacteroidota bacterium]MBS1608187.1 UpxY family transcription antiterminator [Bacteroidota bacterium]
MPAYYYLLRGGEMTAEKQWYLVYLKEHSEKKVIDTLTRKNIVTFLPLTKVKKQTILGSPSFTWLPLFERLLFVHLAVSEINLVNQTEGVLNFFYWLSTLAVISDEDIQAIRIFLDIYQNVSCEKIPLSTDNGFGLPEKSELEAGSLGKPEKLQKLLLPSLGYFLIAHETEEIKESILRRAIG